MIFAVIVQNIRNPCTKLLNLSNLMKVAHYDTMRAFHFLCQFPRRLASIFLNKLIQLLFITLNKVSGMIISARSKFPSLTYLSQFLMVLRDIASLLNTSEASRTGSVVLATRLKAIRRWCHKCSFLSTRHCNLMT